MEMSVVALHGFLGRGADWDFLRPRFSVLAPDLFAPVSPPPVSLEHWASEWTRSLPVGKHVLVGYSLGGRLALHALLAAPERFHAAVLISAHPGLATEKERAARRADDALWAERFRTEPWADVVGSWEARGVFSGTYQPRREEDSYSRERLSHGLLGWSLGAQADLRPRLAELPPELRLFWLAGERDAKFAALAEDGARCRGSVQVVGNSGHRVPWDRPDVLSTLLQSVSETL